MRRSSVMELVFESKMSASMDWGKQEREHSVSAFQVYLFSSGLFGEIRFDDICLNRVQQI